MLGRLKDDPVTGADRRVARIAVDLDESDFDVLLRCRRLAWRRNILRGGYKGPRETEQRAEHVRPSLRRGHRCTTHRRRYPTARDRRGSKRPPCGLPYR